nr:hypothetical protein [Tanacetum cinerariifolium]
MHGCNSIVRAFASLGHDLAIVLILVTRLKNARLVEPCTPKTVYRSNPRYAIKECSSCGTLYTKDCVCSMGTVEDKILIPKPPKNCARYCGVTHEPYQCQPLNHDYYHGQNSCYDSNSIGYDQSQPQQYTVNHPIFNAHNDLLISQTILNEQMTQLKSMCEIFCQSVQKKREEKRIEEEQAAKAQTWKLPVCYDDDDEDYTSVITPDEPFLSTEEPNNSLSMGDEHLDTIPATESDEFLKSGVENLIPIPSESEGVPEQMCDVPSHDNSPPLDVSKDQVKDFSESNKEFSSIDDDSFSIDDIDYIEASPPDSELVSSEVMEIVILKVGGIDDDILLTIEHDDLREKLRNVNLLISKIEALNVNPTPFFDCKTKSSSTSLNSLLDETNTFDNSLLEFETFCFDVEEISSGSTTTHPDISLPEYEAFYDDHVKEFSSGKYDCFRFTVEPSLRDFTKDVVEDISPTKEPQVLTDLPTHPTLQLNMKFQPSSESLFAYVVWIFLSFLVYSVVSPYLLSLRNNDILFDPCICKSTFSKPDISHRCGTVTKFNTHRSHLNECPMLIHRQNNPLLDVLLFHFYPP